MENTSRHIKKVPVAKRPYGYIVIYVLLEDGRLKFFGECELRSDERWILFYYLIDSISTKDRVYDLGIYLDEKFQVPIVEATVQYVPSCSFTIEADYFGDFGRSGMRKLLTGVFNVICSEYIVERMDWLEPRKSADPSAVIYYLDEDDVGNIRCASAIDHTDLVAETSVFLTH